MESAALGLILDSSIFIAAERQRKSVKQILEQIQKAHGEIEVGLSAVTVAELTHGIYRAKTDDSRERRRAFVDELIRDVPVHPLTLEAARLAGRIEGEQAACHRAGEASDRAIR